jgi:DNA-binding NarL/FixJ family response regulator
MLDDFNRSSAPGSGGPWPPVAVVDVSLRSGEEGLALVRRLRVRYPHLKLIVVGNHDDALAGLSALEAGANGFVPKGAIADLPAAVAAVVAGQQYVSPAMHARALH